MITDPIESAKETVSGIVDDIKGFFDNLKLKLPKIEMPKMPKMPKFTLTGQFSLMPPSVPKIGVNWNALGGVFTKPTIFNTANAGLQGVGEAGAEAILPLNNRVLGTIGKAIAQATPKETHNDDGILVHLLQRIATAVESGQSIQIDGREVAKSTEKYTSQIQGEKTNISMIARSYR